MGEWKKTSCALCGINCGLEMYVEDNRIKKVKPNKANPRSEGYICRKGMNILNYQYHEDRLTTPLKKEGEKYIPISWEQAIDEIALTLSGIRKNYGPRSIAYMGGGGVASHSEAPFAVAFLDALDSQYFYNPLGQEFSGVFWAMGKATGSQLYLIYEDIHHADMLIVAGWNGMQSHQIPQARKVLMEFSKNPNKLLVVIDPRESETARIADIHLCITPGTDALLTRAMIAIIIQEGWANLEYIKKHVNGFEEIRPLFDDFDAKAAISECGVDYETVRDVCRHYARRQSSFRPDLGVFMGRHSTVTSALHIILWAIAGRICVPGGNVISGWVAPVGKHTSWDDPNIWRTLATDFAPTNGVYPPAVLPEEILSDHPERIRAVYVSKSNPLRSYPDTTAYEEAFSKLDLLVTTEISFTETAALSDYVLPSRSQYECYDFNIFSLNFPEIYFLLRQPLVPPQGQGMEAGEILLRITEKMGLLPAYPKELETLAHEDRTEFFGQLAAYVMENPDKMDQIPLVLGKTLGKVMGSVHLSACWGLFQIAPPFFREAAERAGFGTDPGQGERIFQAVLDTPDGLWVGKMDPDRNIEMLQTPDGKIDIRYPELVHLVREITPENEKMALSPDPEYPLILQAGRHFDKNANTRMRNPGWNNEKKRSACTLLVHPDDAEFQGLKDKEIAIITTTAGSETVEIEISPETRKGQVILPHGFGLGYKGQKHGANVNRLTPRTNRDELAGTPLHKYVPCKLEKTQT